MAHVIPRRQVRAFDKAMAERLGLNLDEIGDDFHVHFNTQGEETTEVKVMITAYLPTDEVLAMFNEAGGA